MDWIRGMRTKESNYTKLFDPSHIRRMKLLLSDTKNAAGGTGLKRNIKSLGLNING